MNLFQSCVPLGSNPKIFSAAIIAPSHDLVDRLMVVKNIDPPLGTKFEKGNLFSRNFCHIFWELSYIMF